MDVRSNIIRLRVVCTHWNMSKIGKLKKKFKRTFGVLMNGNAEEYKEAKKEIDRIYHAGDAEKFKKVAVIALDFIKKYDQVKNVKNKKAFLSGLSLFFLVLSDEYFDELYLFALKVIQDPHGHVREAIRNASDWLFISLSSRMSPFTYSRSQEIPALSGQG